MPTATIPDTQTLVTNAIKKVTAIATLPEITARIVATVENPKSTASQLHQIVSHDPALATRILKIVNSAFYGLPGQIGSLEKAIVMLGLNAVKNIAVSASLGQLFRGVKLCDDFTAKDLWTHCISVAVVARELAKQMKLPIVDEAFLAGLIHDVGVLVALQVWPDKLQLVCKNAKAEGSNFCEIEREICGCDHQQLGQALTEQWRFPRSCQLVAGYHHHPTTLADNNRLLVTLVYIADTLCCQKKSGFNLTALHQKLEEGGLADVNIDTRLVLYTIENADDLISTAIAIFS